MTAKAAPQLPLTRLVAYALPGVPLAILVLPVYVFVPSLYIQRGLAPEDVGFVLIAIRAADALTDPLMGFVSDRTPWRRWRRKLWIAIGAPLTMLAAYMLFVPPDGPSLAYFALWSFLLTLAWTIVAIPYNAWGAELSIDYHGRTRVAAYRESFIVVGTLLATGAAGILAGIDGGDLTRALEIVALIVVTLMPVATGIALRAVPAPGAYALGRVPLWRGTKIVLANAPFRRLIAAFLINGLANGVPATLFFIFVSERIGMPEWGGPLLFIYFICGIAAVPFWTFVARRIGKHRAWILAMLWACLVFPWTPFVVGPGDIEVFLAITVLTGLSLGADLTLPPALQADVVDEDTAASGEERTGLYFALWSFANKLSLALAALVFPLLVLLGFDAGSEAHSESGLLALALVYSSLPVAFKLIAIVLMARFEGGPERQARLRSCIESSPMQAAKN